MIARMETGRRYTYTDALHRIHLVEILGDWLTKTDEITSGIGRARILSALDARAIAGQQVAVAVSDLEPACIYQAVAIVRGLAA